MSQLGERLFPLLAAALAVASVWSGIDVLLHQTAYQGLSASIAFAAAAVLGSAATAVWLNLRVRRAVAFFCGCCLAVFTLSSLTVGRDSLEGAADVVVLVAAAAAAVLSFTIKGRKAQS